MEKITLAKLRRLPHFATVEVTWLDSDQGTDTWYSSDEMDEYMQNDGYATTIGYVYSVDDTFLTLVGGYTDDEYSQPQRIPLCAIKLIKH